MLWLKEYFERGDGMFQWKFLRLLMGVKDFILTGMMNWDDREMMIKGQ